MGQEISISLEFFLMLLFGGVTLFITAPMAWVLSRAVKDQGKLEQDLSELETEFTHFKDETFINFKDKVQSDFVRIKELNRRFDQVGKDIEEIKNIQVRIFKKMDEKADKT